MSKVQCPMSKDFLLCGKETKMNAVFPLTLFPCSPLGLGFTRLWKLDIGHWTITL